MKYEVLVIVFPSIFSKYKVSSLIANIKKVLKIQNQKFCKIRKEGDVIIVEQMIQFLHHQPSTHYSE